MVKAVVDIHSGIICVDGELHSDLKSMLLGSGSKQEHLYGINLIWDPFPDDYDSMIEFDSLINTPRNRDDGYPRAGRTDASPEKRKAIKTIVEKWVDCG